MPSRSEAFASSSAFSKRDLALTGLHVSGIFVIMSGLLVPRFFANPSVLGTRSITISTEKILLKNSDMWYTGGELLAGGDSMSMRTLFAREIPEETRRLVEPLLSPDSVYRLVGNEVEQIISDEDFVGMYAEEGRPAVNPVVLALVSVFQFLEKLPDRAAAEAAVMRLDWK
jgi:hypothetical protein